MKPRRFEDIMKYLYFNDNEGEVDHAVKAWKIRPVLRENVSSSVPPGKGHPVRRSGAESKAATNVPIPHRHYPVDRSDWCPIQFKQSKRPKRIQRSTYRIAQARDYPQLVALSWMDSRSVNMLATGCSTHLTSVLRTEKDETRSTVPCPQLVVDYGLGMGGVDIYDQLRLQPYSIQRCMPLRKYYKQLFLCLVGMTVVNGYILRCLTLKKRGDSPPTHAEYLCRLHISY
ncbi:unnamed protein product [Phytophthora fragariaefolia]|uniref:Unnamed protein product n=1 Tax=Phytophthora fragariaefolia TaxID=1490495 RepID=A0A9W7CQ86_9STRA|nr:unnamed protein product [Phytophthora fragariaefolia]